MSANSVTQNVISVPDSAQKLTNPHCAPVGGVDLRSLSDADLFAFRRRWEADVQAQREWTASLLLPCVDMQAGRDALVHAGVSGEAEG